MGIRGVGLAWGLFAALAAGGHADEARAPATVRELWADFDPRREPLDAQLVREWRKDGIVLRTVTFRIGTFKGQPARMAAFFAFPEGAKKLPGLLHLHGGGQRAFLHEVEFYARRGYACLSINWGGREMEEARPGDPNTAWGAVDPTQNNVPGYSNLLPGPGHLDPFPSPRNNNWYLLTLGARRGLTYLEQQPEADAERLGVYGHSMGGNLTVYVAGCDRRVKAAAPSVGGSGFRHAPWPLLPEHRPQALRGDPKLHDATLGFESYAPHVAAPLLWLSSTNDFHGVMDDICRTGALIPHGQVRYAFAPHLNHRFTPEFAVTRPLWLDQHLQSGFALPNTPATTLRLDCADGVPELHVAPDLALPPAAVHCYYSVDPDPRARFWRSAPARRAGAAWTAKLPVSALEQPLFAFANVEYPLPKKTAAGPQSPAAEAFALSSLVHAAAPAELHRAGVKATDQPESTIHRSAEGWRDWYVLSGDNPHHWEYSTRKIGDSKWRGADGQKLALEVHAAQPNELVIVLTENFFRGYRGPTKEFAAVVKLVGGPEPQTVALAPGDFAADDGARLASWRHLDVLGLRAYRESKAGQLRGSKNWRGPQPAFRRLLWQPAVAIPRAP